MSRTELIVNHLWCTAKTWRFKLNKIWRTILKFHVKWSWQAISIQELSCRVETYHEFRCRCTLRDGFNSCRENPPDDESDYEKIVIFKKKKVQSSALIYVKYQVGDLGTREANCFGALAMWTGKSRRGGSFLRCITKLWWCHFNLCPRRCRTAKPRRRPLVARWGDRSIRCVQGWGIRKARVRDSRLSCSSYA